MNSTTTLDKMIADALYSNDSTTLRVDVRHMCGRWVKFGTTCPKCGVMVKARRPKSSYSRKY